MRQDVPAGTTFAKVGGGTSLTFAANTGFLQSTPEMPASYDATVAAAGGFLGVTAPGLVAMPPLASGISAGTQITSADLMGEAGPGYNLGTFTPGTTTLPMFSWTAPSPAPTDVIVRTFDRSENDPSAPTTTICRLDPTATSFTMPQAVFSALTLNTSGQFYDVHVMDLIFANFAVAPVTGSTTDEVFFSSAQTKEKNIFFRKQ